MTDNFAYLDIETTGLNPFECAITELAIVCGAAQYSFKFGLSDEEYEKASSKALEIQNYDHKVRKNFPRFIDEAEEVYTLLNKIFVEDKKTVAGQNISFDTSFLEYHLWKSGCLPGGRLFRYSFDLQNLTKHSLPWLKKPRLKNICKVMGISNEGAHSALVDVERTRAAMEKLWDATEEEKAEWRRVWEEVSDQ
jgi:DNA polymerase III alpha subunit (gram-positive type)